MLFFSTNEEYSIPSQITEERLDFLRLHYQIEDFVFAAHHGLNLNAIRIRDGRQVVIKLSEEKAVHIDENDVEWPMEIAIHKHLGDSPYKADLLEFYIFKSYYICVLERTRHSIGLKAFSKMIDDLTEMETCYFQTMIIRIIEHLHDKGVHHRGLGLDDFVFDLHTATMRIFDLTNVRFAGDEMESYLGDPAYSPPEWLTRGKVLYDSLISWSLGLLFYLQINKIYSKDLLSEIKRGNLNLNVRISQDAAIYILESVNLTSNARISFQDHVDYIWLHDVFDCFTLQSPEEKTSYKLCENLEGELCSFCTNLKKICKFF